jgi:hypothetical protein
MPLRFNRAGGVVAAASHIDMREPQFHRFDGRTGVLHHNDRTASEARHGVFSDMPAIHRRRGI